jgi:hypothetical protein
MKYLKMIRETTGTILTVKCPLQFDHIDYRVVGWLQGWITYNHPEFFILEIVENVDCDLLTNLDDVV